MTIRVRTQTTIKVVASSSHPRAGNLHLNKEKAIVTIADLGVESEVRMILMIDKHLTRAAVATIVTSLMTGLTSPVVRVIAHLKPKTILKILQAQTTFQ